MRNKQSVNPIWYGVFAIVLYIAIAFIFYRFRHPDMTETQLLFHFVDAVCWR